MEVKTEWSDPKGIRLLESAIVVLKSVFLT